MCIAWSMDITWKIEGKNENGQSANEQKRKDLNHEMANAKAKEQRIIERTLRQYGKGWTTWQ